MNCNYLFWNMRDLGTSIHRLRKLVKRYKPRKEAIAEPWQTVDKMGALQKKLKFNFGLSNGDLGGKLKIMWDYEI